MMNKVDDSIHHLSIPVRRYLPIIYMVALGIVVSVAMSYFVYQWEETHQRMEFESRASAYANAMESTLREYVGALLFLGDFFNNSWPVTRQQFNNFVASVLPRYPGIQGFGWDPLVKDVERAAYESAARKEGFAKFQFTERSEENELVRAARREEYVIVYYIYPLETNRPAFGFDIASNGTRLKAIKKAFKTGELSVTGRITLVQETGSQYGVLILLPIYHPGASLNSPEERLASRSGFVVEVLRIGQAVETALKGFADEGIALALYDMSAEKGNRLLYHRSTRMSKVPDLQIPAEDIQKGLFWSKTFPIAERQWKVIFSPSEFYYRSRRAWQPWIVLLGLLLLTTLLALNMRKKILYTAEIEQRIAEQAQTNQRLETEIRVRTALEAERDKTIDDLRQALNEVNTLRGILPICSFCKKVRDDQGYWEQVDVYIRKHSRADFSHSICPECAKDHYPGIYKKSQPDGE